MQSSATTEGTWSADRARGSNRRWWAVGAVLALVTAVLLSAGSWLPYAWTQAMWSSQRAAASTAELDLVAEGTEYADVLEMLGPVSYEAPGFSRHGVPDAAVCVWQDTEFGEVRGMFLDGCLSGSLLVFE